MVKHVGRTQGMNWICECGKTAEVHATRYDDEDTCIHLYFCYECWWEYEKKPRQMTPAQIARRKKDVERWNRGYPDEHRNNAE